MVLVSEKQEERREEQSVRGGEKRMQGKREGRMLGKIGRKHKAKIVLPHK